MRIYNTYILTLLLTLVACVEQAPIEIVNALPDGHVPIGTDRSPADDSGENSSFFLIDEDVSSNAERPTVGLKNYIQLRETMDHLTLHVNTGQNKYNSLEQLLPTGHSITELTSSKMQAIIQLASDRCDLLFRDERNNSNMEEKNQFYQLAQINISAPNVLLNTSAKKNDFSLKILNYYWGRDTRSQTEQSAQINHLNNLIEDLLSGEEMNSVQTTHKVTFGLCVTMLTSFPVITL